MDREFQTKPDFYKGGIVFAGLELGAQFNNTQMCKTIMTTISGFNMLKAHQGVGKIDWCSVDFFLQQLV